MGKQSNIPFKQPSVVRFVERPSLEITGAPNRKILEVAEKTVREIKIPDTRDEISREKMCELAGLLSGTGRDHRLFLKDKLLIIKRSLGQGIRNTDIHLGKQRSVHPGTTRWKMNALAALNIKRRQMKAVETLIFIIEESFSKDLAQN